MTQILPLTAQLKQLTCHEEGKGWRKTEPYLWCIFFKIDGEHLSISPEFKLQGEAEFQFSEGSHGNLGVESVVAGDSVNIPPAVGLYQSTLRPIPVPFFNYQIPGIIGLVVVLMEKENVSGPGAEAGHKALNDYVREAVNQAIREFDVKEIDVEDIQASIRKYFSNKVDEFVDGIETAVAQAVVEAQNIFQNIWALLDRDNLVGYRIWDINQQDLEEHSLSYPLEFRLTTPKMGDWEIQGMVHGTEIPSPIDVEIE